MGRALTRLISADPNYRLAAALTQSSSRHLGEDVGEVAGLAPLGLPLSADVDAAFKAAEVVIDFSLASATAALLSAAQRHQKPLVLATTGQDPRTQQAIRATAQKVPLVWAANTSLGVTLLAQLVAQAAAALDWDIEVLELHHRHKRDAPSGTARLLGEAAAEARGWSLPAVEKTVRDGLRGEPEIGFASLRGGDAAGEHQVTFLSNGERIELSHRATHRDIFARGALVAASWLAGQPPGLYGMAQVLGMRPNH